MHVPADFFRELYARCPPEESVNVRLLTRRNGLPGGARNLFCKVAEAPVRIPEIVAENPADDVFFGVSTRSAGGTCKADCLHVPALFCDLDLGKMGAEGAEEARDRLVRFPLPPSYVISSGTGWHVYWLLKEPATGFPTLEARNKGIAVELGGDLACADVSRILRVPGSLNHKYNPPRPCSVFSPFNGERY